MGEQYEQELEMERHTMTPEEWEKHKDCDTAKRDHKWQWRFDIAAGKTSETHAICVHCGKETYMKREAPHGNP
jgi:hypothetical protein